MAGRRLRDAVKTVLTSGGNGEFDSGVHVVIAGLTNTYSQYVTTFEEYEVQRYEVCKRKKHVNRKNILNLEDYVPRKFPLRCPVIQARVKSLI